MVSLYFLELTDVFKPVHSGFSCYDRSLSMPYIEPTQEAIPLLMLLSLAFAGPAITVSIAPDWGGQSQKTSEEAHVGVANGFKAKGKPSLAPGPEEGVTEVP